MNKDQFDQMFDAAFEVSSKQFNDNVSIDHRPSWLRVQQRLSARRKRRNRFSRLSKLSVIAASVLIGAAIFGNSQATKAIDPIYTTIKEYPSGLLGFFMGRSEDQNTSQAETPSHEYLEGLDVQKINENLIMANVSKAQAGHLLSFEAPMFQYSPSGYSFYQAQVYFYDGNDKADQAIYLFNTEEGKFMTVQLRKLPQDTTGFGMNAEAEGVTVTKVDLSDGPAILTSATDGSNALDTISHGLQITLSGVVPKDELIEMYEGMYE
ncbi:DUF4367 domain-containing protein [Cohnella herbarum]|uniref:DUF4367 domain-containing protein n=1 Tax=Cohnella herbarum TaxID=2728023 RepID=A0A7Z2ZQJ1_9BACL|nr:DUF4367 domain-containing protein [Cohnella herbarum]QJD87082.1 DUF4367 domain-containing protein [Cohnella herbarum]